MENSATMEFNKANSQTEKRNSFGTFVTMMAVPTLIGLWAATCFVGLVVSHSGPAAWSLIS